MSATETVGPKPSSATVVITEHLRPGREAEFRKWQHGVDEAAASFTGFLDTEVIPPLDAQTEWSVVYRFDGTANLKRWLDSDTRRTLLESGADLFEKPQSQAVLPDKNDEVVTVVVSHKVAADREDDFLAWQQRISQMEKAFPGFRTSELHRPIPGVQNEWTIVNSFASIEDLNRWLDSPERAAILAEGADFSDFDLQRVATPYGSWFPSSSGAQAGPPDWKTSLAVLCGLYPLVVLLTLGLTELWPGAQLWISLLVGNILSVSLLTWVVMPIVTRALAFWLEPQERAGRRNDLIGLAATVIFIVFAATLFYLVTRVVWHLP
ncbi:antibiotic biosynthesis monooxygenase [Antrihabitans stalactiti]|uniref:Antibiotic biosynthesis monooxygenase n=1 Tax=Antrihabitans stalactiti TaxID=2584121 RepID=A0A848KRI2_9NOCA|nr:antibiotic biosynthesis monooxygenase [Antrihabitans stalactiti]NMN98207.1 antibiotic biosynthesis monooxygenase [Antrihabitans stalactiti]